MRKKNLHVLQKSIALLVCLLLCSSSLAGVFTLDSNCAERLNPSIAAQNLRVSTIQDEKSVISFSSAYLPSGDTQVNIIVDSQILKIVQR